MKTVQNLCTANHLTRTSACKKNSKHPDTISNPRAHAGGPFARNATYRAVISLKNWSEDLEKSEACSLRLWQDLRFPTLFCQFPSLPAMAIDSEAPSHWNKGRSRPPPSHIEKLQAIHNEFHTECFHNYQVDDHTIGHYICFTYISFDYHCHWISYFIL